MKSNFRNIQLAGRDSGIDPQRKIPLWRRQFLIRINPGLEPNRCPPTCSDVMNRAIDTELLFPIRDRPSAQLMAIKAECLHMAGVISDCEEQAVLRKAAEALAASDGDRELVLAERDVCVYGLKAHSQERHMDSRPSAQPAA
jgi:hypothetical protein